MGRSTEAGAVLERQSQVPQVTAQQKTEIVLASLRGPMTITELCREHDIADSLLRKWREQFLAAGAERLQGASFRAGRRRRAQCCSCCSYVKELGVIVWSGMGVGGCRRCQIRRARWRLSERMASR